MLSFFIVQRVDWCGIELANEWDWFYDFKLIGSAGNRLKLITLFRFGSEFDDYALKFLLKNNKIWFGDVELNHLSNGVIWLILTWLVQLEIDES